MAAIGGADKRSFTRRVDSIVRERDSIRRLLDQARISSIVDEIKSLEKRLGEIESLLSGRK